MDIEQVIENQRESLELFLAEKSGDFPYLRGGYISTVDGHALAHFTSQNDDPLRISAMCGSLFALAETLTDELSGQDCRHIAIQSASGPIVLVRVPDKTQQFVMSAVADLKAPLGGLLSWVNEVSREVAATLDEGEV